VRPIERGAAPAEAGTWTHYRDALSALAGRIGWCCSYCEAPIQIGAHVEHKLPRDSFPELELTWVNFVIACVHCNSNKSSLIYPLDEHVWPDRDNTALAFTYKSEGRVEVSATLTPAISRLAEATDRMVGLTRLPGSGAGPRDRRWLLRREAWELAVRERKKLPEVDSPGHRDTVAQLAARTGFWSVWMTVFEDDNDMRQRVIDAVAGTASCFDADTNPIARVGGKL
jgi:uncharacterized protein (TIGR02646 family)